MLVLRHNWSREGGWTNALPSTPDNAFQLVLSFGSVDAPPQEWFDAIKAAWPSAQHVYASGGGQISEATVDDDVAVVTAIRFSKATVHAVERGAAEVANSAELGAEIGWELASIDKLEHVLVFAEGLSLNGDGFAKALQAALPKGVSVSGGLASNGLALTRTVVGLNGPPASGRVVAIGLADTSLVIGTGSVGGWEPFGPERVVTRSETAVVFELDGENALEVYKRYLGAFASELPGVALLFPLAVTEHADGPVAVRTILAIDEETGSLRFAGDIKQGSTVRLMRATPDKLVSGAADAARFARRMTEAGSPVLTLCVSCIGRRAVLRSRVEEELEEIVLASAGAPVVGFYSNGEIAPPSDGRSFSDAVLHNQTMTVTVFSER